jgi:glucose-6-phosphate dehydrogenase assembly protein OpcA
VTVTASPDGVVRGGHVSGLHAVTRELSEMRMAMLRAGSENRGVRLSVLTLVAACADRDSADGAVAVIERMAASHPTRAIVLVADPDGPQRIEADLSLRCSTASQGQVCVELVRLEVGGESALHLRSVVGPMLLPDVPVLLWLAGAPRLVQALSRDSLELCERLIVDSDAYPDPLATLTALAAAVRTGGHIAGIGDLAWTRIRGWRELLGRAFDTPELRGYAAGIEEVEVLSTSDPPGAQARLLAGWLLSRLDRPGFRVPAVRHAAAGGDGRELLGLTLRAGLRDRRATVRIGDAGGRRTLDISIEGAMRSQSSSWTVEVDRPGLAELVGAEIQEQGADPVYTAALLAAVEGRG